MTVCTEEFTIVEGMTAMTEPTGRKDETYYWTDNVIFSVEDVLFRVSPYPFILGSAHFVKRYGLLCDNDRSGTDGAIHLDGVTAAQFRVLLKFLFPVHITSTTSTFTKEEWLTILTLSTLWHFHDARKLAIQHLDGQLADLELILVGRAAYIPRWVLAGYRGLVERPRLYTLTEDVGDAIGHREVNRLWAIRYHCAVFKYDDNFVRNTLSESFCEELAELAAKELDHRTTAEVERDKRDAEERLLLEIEAKKEQERLALEEARIRTEEQEERRRVEELQYLDEMDYVREEEAKVQKPAEQWEQIQREQTQGDTPQRGGGLVGQEQDEKKMLEDEQEHGRLQLEYEVRVEEAPERTQEQKTGTDLDMQEQSIEEEHRRMFEAEKGRIERLIAEKRQQLARSPLSSDRIALRKDIMHETQRLRLLEEEERRRMRGDGEGNRGTGPEVDEEETETF